MLLTFGALPAPGFHSSTPRAQPDWTADGSKAFANLGWSVASAGDVNGDGYGDVIIGAPNYDNGETNEGQALLYPGSASGLSSTPTWTVEGNQDQASLGTSVAGAGDVDGDGYDDAIVGVPLYSNGQINEGAAYLYLGTPAGLSTTPIWTSESDQAGADFGWSVASTGDVNADGYSDVIVGAYYYASGRSIPGR